jgi:hypothetical protein
MARGDDDKILVHQSNSLSFISYESCSIVYIITSLSHCRPSECVCVYRVEKVLALHALFTTKFIFRAEYSLALMTWQCMKERARRRRLLYKSSIEIRLALGAILFPLHIYVEKCALYIYSCYCDAGRMPKGVS